MTRKTAHTFLLQFNTDKRLNPSEHEALRVAINELAMEIEDWVPVSERLPEKSGLYLVSIGDLVTTLSFCGNGFRTPFGSEYSVDAWQPLPKPYKESEEQE